MAEKRLVFHLFQQGAENVSSKFGGVEKSLTSMAKSAMGTVASVYTLKKAFDFTVSAAIKQEEIFRKLQTSVELTGKSWDSAKDDLDQMFASLQATTQYGDTETAEVLTTLMQLTSDYDKSIKGLPIALDLAATGLFDTGTAAKYVAMALEGNVEMLGRYIPELKSTNNDIVKNGTAAEKSAEFMRIFNEKFAGTAQKNLQSTAGQMKQLQNYLGDIGEAIGGAVLPVMNNLLGTMIDIVKVPMSQKLKDEQSEFNNLISTLNNANLSQETRNQLIETLQTKYKSYIGNIDLESASIQKLTAMQKAANDEFNRKIQLAASEEILRKEYEKINNVQMRLTKAQLELTKAQERANTQMFVGGTYVHSYRSDVTLLELKIEGLNKQLENAKKEFNEVSATLNGLGYSFNTATNSVVKYGESVNDISSESINKTIEDIGKLPLLFELSTEAANKYHKGISELEVIDIPKQEKLFDELLYINTDYTSAYAQEWIKGNEAELKSTQQFISQASSALGSFSNYQSTLANNRIREAQDAAEAEIAAIQESGKSEQQKEIEIAQIKANLRELEKAELAKLKPIKYAQSISNTALGVTGALSMQPWTPLNFVLAAMVAAAGAAEIATIAAQKYATGGIVPGYGANDTVPAMLTPGEVILNQSQQSNLVQNMGGITINVQGNLVATEEEADRFAKIIQERSKLGYNRIAVN